MAKMTLEEREKYARKSLIVLAGGLLHAHAQTKNKLWGRESLAFDNMRVQYKDLAEAIKFPKPHKGSHFGTLIGNTLADMRVFLNLAAKDAPLIEVLAVGGNGFPGPGFSAPCKRYKAKASKKDKLSIVNAEFAKVLRYGNKWGDVIEKLDWHASYLSLHCNMRG